MNFGESGQDDKFSGTKIPIVRKIAKKSCDISLYHVANLLQNKLQEGSFVAFVLLVEKIKFQPEEVRDIYLKNIRLINN
jgi:hypothetical protein